MDCDAIIAAQSALAWELRYRKRFDLDAERRWFLDEIDHLDPDFAAALDAYAPPTGTLLEIGAGSGRQAIHYARRGYRVTATDVAPTCLADARAIAAQAGATIGFVEDDITHTALAPGFDLICDRGCFTVLEAPLQPRYVANVAALLKPGGLLLIKVDRRKAPQLDRFAGWDELGRSEGRYESHTGRKNRAVMAVFRAPPI